MCEVLLCGIIDGIESVIRRKQKTYPQGQNQKTKAGVNVMAKKNRVITQRDVLMIETINRFGFFTASEVIEVFGFKTKAPAYLRLKALCDKELLNHKRILYEYPGAYWPTKQGQLICNSSLTPISVPRVSTFEHELRVVQVFNQLKKKYGDELQWITGRELLSTRIAHHSDNPNAFKTEKSKIPDGIAEYNEKRFAVEVELSLKSRARFKKIVERYVNQLEGGIYTGILYYSPEPLAARVAEYIMAFAGIRANRFIVGKLP